MVATLRSGLLSLLLLLALGLELGFSPAAAQTDIVDLADPFDLPLPGRDPGDAVAPKQNAAQLLEEAAALQQDGRLLDSRSRLLLALQQEPRNIRIHLMLAEYYLRHVGHFRLSLKYIKHALQLLREQQGAPPYSDLDLQERHAELLYLLCQSRLNLDDYQGALQAIKEYERWGYFTGWIPASRAWILMKLGRLDEAVSTARLGVLSGFNPGHVLNVLGILLSMTGERQLALDVFNRALQFELTRSTEAGNPATPLNNAGEVYKELFLEEQAESSWRRAILLPDGCEHVLPSLNLGMLYVDQGDFSAAEQALVDFESCFAQYPLRNGEEHRALVHMLRGRIRMHSGHFDQALQELEAARQRRQWFGKIGTNAEDLQAAVFASYAKALRRQSNELRFRPPENWRDRARLLGQRTVNSIQAWWLLRRARQILVADLNNFEDLSVRHTDSMLEYPTLGELISSFPTRTALRRLDLMERRDRRIGAGNYYQAYRGEILLKSGRRTEGRRLLLEVFNGARVPADRLLQLHSTARLLKDGALEPREQQRLAGWLFEQAPAFFLAYGLKLPVQMEIPQRQAARLAATSNFQAAPAANWILKYSTTAAGHSFELHHSDGRVLATGQAESIPAALQALRLKVFQ